MAGTASARSIPPSRWLPQLLFVLVVIGGATLRNLGLPAQWIPELRALCPIGAVEALASATGLSGVTDWSRLVVPAGVLLTAVVLGAVFCGRLCPLGSVQEWVGIVGRRILGNRYNRPVPGDRMLRHLRFLVLAAVAGSVFFYGAAVTDAFNPSPALIHGWTATVPVTALVVLVLVLGASFFVERPWCRWLCPYGALLGTAGRLAPVTVRRNPETCVDCSRCDRACPLTVSVSSVNAVRDDRCNRCERCVASCPVSGALVMGVRAPGRPLHRGRLSAAALLLFFTPLLFSYVAEHTTAGTVSAPPESVTTLAAEDITPMMTLADLAERAGISSGTLLDRLGLPADLDAGIFLIDIEDEPGLEHATVGHIRSVLTENSQ